MSIASLGSIIAAAILVAASPDSDAVRVAAPLLAAAAAIIAGVQAYIDPGGSYVRHLATARQWSAVRRSCESALALRPDDPAQFALRVEEIRQLVDFISATAENVPDDIRERFQQEVLRERELNAPLRP